MYKELYNKMINNNKAVKRFFCPFCKSEMFLKQEFAIGLGRTKSMIKKKWHCSNKDCVYFFPLDWFQRFDHFDKFLILKGQDEGKRLREINSIKLEKF